MNTVFDAGSECAPAAAAVHPPVDLPETLYRTHVLTCDQPDKSFAFDFMSDYLTMMDVLAKSIAHELDRVCGITPLQYRAMVRLLDVDEAAAGSLAHDLGVGASTVSTAVSKLVCRGLLERSESLSDMRTVHLALSDAGRALVQHADAAVFATMQEYWGSLTSEQFDAASRSSMNAVELHSHPRIEGGALRLDTALVDTVMISRMLTSRALQAYGLAVGDFRVMLALRVMGHQRRHRAIPVPQLQRYHLMLEESGSARVHHAQPLRCEPSHSLGDAHRCGDGRTLAPHAGGLRCAA